MVVALAQKVELVASVAAVVVAVALSSGDRISSRSSNINSSRRGRSDTSCSLQQEVKSLSHLSVGRLI